MSAREETEADRAFDALARSYLDEFAAFSPVGATGLGDHRFDAELDQVSAEARAEELAFLGRVRARLAAIDRGKLSRDRQVDASLLAHKLERQRFELTSLESWAWNPLIYTGTAGGAIYGLLAREFAPLSERLRSVRSRLEALPRYLEQVRGTLELKRVPAIHAETAVKQNRGVLSILAELVEPQLGALESDERTRLERAMAQARQAIEAHQDWLETKLLPAAAGDFRIGPELHARKLRFALNTSLAPDEVLRRARSELQRVRGEMYAIAVEVYRERNPYTEFPEKAGRRYQQALIRAALEMCYEDRPDRDEVVAVARQALVETEDFVRARDLVTVPPDPLEIIIMPEFQRGVSLAYCDSPGPLDVGQKTFYAVAPLPDDWNETQVRSFLREYNVRSIHDLSVHEAMPGHFLQLAHSNRYPSVLRAVLASGPFIEGWAVYTEQLLAEEGYRPGWRELAAKDDAGAKGAGGGDAGAKLAPDPLMRLIAHKWYLRGIGNAILDASVHAGSMTRDEAMRLMVEDTFQEEREAAAKWVRAQLTSAQLSTYFVGYQEHVDLRRETEERWGESFALKRYHDRLLSFGSPPVRFVRALLLDLPIPE